MGRRGATSAMRSGSRSLKRGLSVCGAGSGHHHECDACRTHSQDRALEFPAARVRAMTYRGLIDADSDLASSGQSTANGIGQGL